MSDAAAARMASPEPTATRARKASAAGTTRPVLMAGVAKVGRLAGCVKHYVCLRMRITIEYCVV